MTVGFQRNPTMEAMNGASLNCLVTIGTLWHQQYSDIEPLWYPNLALIWLADGE